MALDFSSSLPLLWRKSSRFLLALFWTTGLLCGICVCLSDRSFVSYLMRGAVSGSVSIVGLLLVTFFPFLISAFAVTFSWPVLLLPICFFRAFSYAFVSTGIWMEYGSAGWMIQMLFMFRESAAMPFLYAFWMHHISGEQGLHRFEVLTALLLCAVLGAIEYCILSPFLGRLIA